MILHVESITGPVGLPEPCAFRLGDRQLKVVTIIDRWLSSDHSYFKLKADDGAIYILHKDEHSGQWELTMFQATQQ